MSLVEIAQRHGPPAIAPLALIVSRLQYRVGCILAESWKLELDGPQNLHKDPRPPQLAFRRTVTTTASQHFQYRCPVFQEQKPPWQGLSVSAVQCSAIY